MPFNAQSRLRELQQIVHRDEVHERVADVTSYQAQDPDTSALTLLMIWRKELTVSEIHPQIKEIDPPGNDVRNEPLQIPIAHLVRYVLDHHRRPRIASRLDLLEVDLC